MKRNHFLISLFIAAMTIPCGCSKNDSDETALKILHSNPVLLPENPTTADELCIVHEICSYEEFKSLVMTGKNISYTRQYNSEQKWPCISTTDTILLGQLEEGVYTLVFYLEDLSTKMKDQEVYSHSIEFTVGK